MINKPINLIEQEGIKRLTMPPDLHSHLSTHAYLYLQPHGWFHDFPSDEEGVTPWYTFPAIAFLKDIVDPNWSVLEYGSGYSSLYFKNQVQSLISIEHNQEWADKLLIENPKLNIRVIPENSDVLIQGYSFWEMFVENFPQVRSNDYDHDYRHGLINNEFGGYATEIFRYQPSSFDVIIIDGMARALCTTMAVESKRLKDTGIIILDNSDRWQYNPIQEYLKDQGYGRIDFWGPGWNNHNAWCTSFYSKMYPINNSRLLRIETNSQIFT